MYELGSHRSTIREIFEYGNQRAAIVGRENVLDFSLGNPNVPAPDEVRQAILAEAAGDPVAIHGYTSAPGAPDVRRTHRTETLVFRAMRRAEPTRRAAHRRRASASRM